MTPWKTRRTTPSFPEASSPWRTSRTLRAILGEEAVLELVDPLDELAEPLLALLLPQPEPVAGIALREPCGRPGPNEERSTIARL